MQNATPRSCDVLVIGGGPAGAAIGTLLARRGWHTVVLDKDRHPRFHIGESLLPLSLPYFEQLGVREELDRIGLKKYAAEFHSVYHGKHVAFQFGDAIDKSYPYAYEVRRSEFDHLLLRNCAAQGAEVHEGCRVDGIEYADDAIAAVSAVDDRGGRQNWTARFYVDATGRDTLLADHLGVKEANPRHRSAALYGHFQGAERWTGRDEGNISIYWFDHGWFWMIPLRDGTMSVGAVCRPEYLKSRAVPVEQFFRDTIALCPGVAARLQSASLVGGVTATGNYSYQSRRMTGRNFILVGDAYAFIDPVFSSGVHLALNSAFLGAEAVDGLLKDPASAQARLARFERSIKRGLKTFSWFIYRVTTPAIRDLFMHPQNAFRMQEAVISLLAGDIFRNTPLMLPLFAFRWVYRINSLWMRWRGAATPPGPALVDAGP
ncbi:Dehydrogenase (flavoprotein) [Methylomagnum ishizawai]|uniref:Dehydrogenase (Flavoprotein) n=1 Tax=Methylomagnum ishizawai TaxID=1760988 RepID=A0A1Y6CSK6_9GAMM|nr:NAD(P)/FAD-dependent oxidoreductase [Methylomagnum ishizawai]SMF93306.1 Dehydrogenase (flavoprotein) [Methylomagnum ishizawai]